MQGSIQTRIGKSGRVTWTCVVDAPRDPMTGTRKQKRLSASTKRELEALVTRTLHEIGTGAYIEPCDLSVADLIDRWLAVHVGAVRASTIGRYRRAARVHVLPTIGHVPVAKLTTLTIQDLYRRKLADGLTPAGIRMLHKVLRGALDQAVKWQLVARNVAAMVSLPSEPRPTFEVWDAAQVATFLAVTADDPLWGTLYRLAVFTGMRRGELLALRWADIDLASALVTVRRSLTEDAEGRDVVGEPKSAAGRRSIALPASCVEALRQHRVRQLERRLRGGSAWQDDDVVFDNGAGSPLHSDTVHRAFRRATTAAALPTIRFHDLRHTAATLALAQGIHPKVVQERLGHSSITMTLDRYSHVSVELQRAAADRLDAAILEASNAACDQNVTTAVAEG